MYLGIFVCIDFRNPSVGRLIFTYLPIGDQSTPCQLILSSVDACAGLSTLLKTESQNTEKTYFPFNEPRYMKLQLWYFKRLFFWTKSLVLWFLAVLRVFRPPYRLTHSFKMSRAQKTKKCKLSNRFDGYWLQGGGGRGDCILKTKRFMSGSSNRHTIF